MRRIIAVALFSIPVAAFAAKLDCATKAPEHATAAEKAAMAKISSDQARKIALDSAKGSSVEVSKGELDVEHGCLIYSYDLKTPGKSGAQEVYVDAGTGKVLKTEHESAAKEAAEKAADKTKEVAGKAVDKTKEAANTVKNKMKDKDS